MSVPQIERDLHQENGTKTNQRRLQKKRTRRDARRPAEANPDQVKATIGHQTIATFSLRLSFPFPVPDKAYSPLHPPLYEFPNPAQAHKTPRFIRQVEEPHASESKTINEKKRRKKMLPKSPPLLNPHPSTPPLKTHSHLPTYLTPICFQLATLFPLLTQAIAISDMLHSISSSLA